MARRRKGIACGVHGTRPGATPLLRGRVTPTINGINKSPATACGGREWLDLQNSDDTAHLTALETVSRDRIPEHVRRGCAQSFSESTATMSRSLSCPPTHRPVSDLLNPRVTIIFPNTPYTRGVAPWEINSTKSRENFSIHFGGWNTSRTTAPNQSCATKVVTVQSTKKFETRNLLPLCSQLTRWPL